MSGAERNMADPGGVVSLFATPFAAVNTGADRDFNERLASFCESQRAAAAGETTIDPLHFRSRQDFLDSPDPIAGELKRLVQVQAANVVSGLKSVGAAQAGPLQVQARGWCSIVQPDGHVPAQHFPGASWLAVYCARAGEPHAGSSSAGALRLYERRLGSMYRDAGNSDLVPPYRYGNHTWSPVPGWMALFPAHLPHEVSVVRSDTALVLVFAMLRFPEAG